MACLKCGRDTAAGQVFCDDCLEIMQYYPVKPGTTVQLPKRRMNPPKKTMRRRAPSLEEQIRVLKQRVRILIVCLLVALLIAGLLAVPAYEHLFTQHFRPGQNYTAVTTPVATVTDTTG